MFESSVAFRCFKDFKGWRKDGRRSYGLDQFVDHPPFTMAMGGKFVYFSPLWIQHDPDDHRTVNPTRPTLPRRNAKRGKQQPSSLLMISLLPWTVDFVLSEKSKKGIEEITRKPSTANFWAMNSADQLTDSNKFRSDHFSRVPHANTILDLMWGCPGVILDTGTQGAQLNSHAKRFVHKSLTDKLCQKCTSTHAIGHTVYKYKYK